MNDYHFIGKNEETLTKLETIGTLDDFLLATRHETFGIKLGTVDGGAFIYCGPVQELLDKLVDMDTLYSRKYQEKTMQAETALEKVINEAAAPGNYISGVYKKSKGKKIGTVVGYLDYLQKHIEKCERYRDKAHKLKSNPYVSLFDRQITSVDISVDEEDTLIVLMEGTEAGRYWTTNEYKNGVSEEDSEYEETAETEEEIDG